MAKKTAVVAEGKKLNKFEETRLLSARALELSKGAAPKIDLSKKGTLLGRDYVAIAKEELEAGVLELDVYK